MANSYTPNYNFALPAPGDVNWHDEINGNLETIDSLIASLTGLLNAHKNDTNNPHQVTYDQTGAAPAQHQHVGSDIYGQVPQAANADTVDNVHLRVSAGLLEFSTDGRNYIVAGEMTKSAYDPDDDGSVEQADNSDTVDNIHFRVNGSLLEFSTDGSNYTVAGEMTKATYDPDSDGSVEQADNADTVDNKHAEDFVWKSNTSATGINVPSGQTIYFQTGGTTRAYVNDYGLVGAVYNSDLAEGFITVEPRLPEEGTVMVFTDDGRVMKAVNGGSFAGIVSYHPGLLLGMTHNWEEEYQKHKKVPLALVGQVYAKVDGGKKGVKPGDPLTVGKDGMLKKAKRNQEVVAKAMESVGRHEVRKIKVLIR
jgi:hypothetical protein